MTGQNAMRRALEDLIDIVDSNYFASDYYIRGALEDARAALQSDPGELSPAMEAARQDGYEIGLQEGYETGLAEGRAAPQSVPDGGEEQDCPTCSGTGWISGGDGDNVLCWTCSGEKRLSSKLFAAIKACGEQRRITVPLLRTIVAAVRATPPPAGSQETGWCEALESIQWRSADKDNMEFTATITYSKMDTIRKLLASPPGADTCPICDVTFKADDDCLGDIELGVVHAACCGPERESYVCLDTGEPLGPSDPLPVPFKYAASPKPPVTLDLTPLDFNGPNDAWANLEGAIHDLERTGCDPVSLRTLKRVAGQLAALAIPSGGE